MDIAAIVERRAHIDDGLVIVDTFLNHRVEPPLMTQIGVQLASLCDIRPGDIVATVEASGIAPSMATATAAGVDFIYAKKTVSRPPEPIISLPVASTTKRTTYHVGVRPALLAGIERAWVVDDFLSDGHAALALASIMEECDVPVAGCAFVIEKTFRTGRRRLEEAGHSVASLVVVDSVDEGLIVRRGADAR